MDWVIMGVLIPLILLIFSFRCSLPFLDRICRASIIRRFPSVGISDKEGELDAENHFSAKRNKKPGEVILVDPLDPIFLTWWTKPVYFITFSNGQFFSCPDEEACIEKAKEETLYVNAMIKSLNNQIVC